MRLKEFTNDDIIQYALKNGGRNPRNVYKDVVDEFHLLTNDFSSRTQNITQLDQELKSKFGVLINDIVELHDACMESEDDNETVEIAKSLKDMYNKSTEIFDSL